MYAHVTTYRLGSEAEVNRDKESDGTISDQSARTIASWWHSPAPSCRPITALSHGLPFDTKELRETIAREITDASDESALIEWLDNLEAILGQDYVWFTWHGGANYATPYVGTDAEAAPTIEDVVNICRDRYRNASGEFPGVDDDSEAWVYGRDPREESDPYPREYVRYVPAFQCADCGMESNTDDLTVIGRNCPDSDFVEPHRMVRADGEWTVESV